MQSLFCASLFCDRSFDDRGFVIAVLNVNPFGRLWLHSKYYYVTGNELDNVLYVVYELSNNSLH